MNEYTRKVVSDTVEEARKALCLIESLTFQGQPIDLKAQVQVSRAATECARLLKVLQK